MDPSWCTSSRHPAPAVVVAIVAVLAVAAGCLASPAAHAWESTAKWKDRVVGYRVNPRNLDVPDAEALTAIRFGADVWRLQTQAAFRFRYDGSSTATAIGLDGSSEVLFRDAQGSTETARASTYTWKLGTTIVEIDIVFWDATNSFITLPTPCAGDIYIENTAVHEFGHALGLDHSAVTTAAMWGHRPACNQDRLVLDPDDIAGAEALYPCATDAECDDDDPCTQDRCQAQRCLRTPIVSCCRSDGECDDGDLCTEDRCEQGVCLHDPASCDAGADRSDAGPDLSVHGDATAVKAPGDAAGELNPDGSPASEPASGCSLAGGVRYGVPGDPMAATSSLLLAAATLALRRRRKVLSGKAISASSPSNAP